MSKSKTHTERPFPATLNLPCGGADSHAHLDLLAKRSATPKEKVAIIHAVIERAEAAGISSIGQVFLSPEAYLHGRELFTEYPRIFFLLGIHPTEGTLCTEKTLAQMRQGFREDSRLKAVGEIGLDFYWDDCPPLIQEEAFRLQLALAKEIDLPVVIHSRDAAVQSVAILEAEGFANYPVLWHCFGGDDAVPLLDRLLANGWAISIPGPVTYPANTSLRAAVSRIPLERLHLETDCPYLTPHPWRGKPNEPALTAFTAQTVAECLGMDTPTLWKCCGDNTRHFFNMPPVPGAPSAPQTKDAP